MCGKAFIKTVSKALDSADLKYKVKDDKTVVLIFSRKGEPDICQILRKEGKAMVANSRIRGKVRPECRGEVMSKLMMANFVIDIGSFDLDPMDGELRFRSSQVTTDINGLEGDLVLLHSAMGIRMYRQILDVVGDVFED